MLSITKINASTNQKAAKLGGKSCPHYLGAPTTRQRGDFDDYARGKDGASGPAPFWACKGSALLGLDDIAEAEQVERLAKGFHPITGKPLVKGAGDGHVMGLDMTFSAPKDFSAVFAGADRATQDALVECLHQSAKAALGYAEQAAVTRHDHGGRIKQIAEAAVAACYKRSLDFVCVVWRRETRIHRPEQAGASAQEKRQAWRRQKSAAWRCRSLIEFTKFERAGCSAAPARSFVGCPCLEGKLPCLKGKAPCSKETTPCVGGKFPCLKHAISVREREIDSAGSVLERDEFSSFQFDAVHEREIPVLEARGGPRAPCLNGTISVLEEHGEPPSIDFNRKGITRKAAPLRPCGPRRSLASNKLGAPQSRRRLLKIKNGRGN